MLTDANVLLFGFSTLMTVVPPIVVLVALRLMRCPTVPSRVTSPIFPLVLIVTVLLPPIVMRSVNWTSEAVYGDGATKKSAVLVAVPAGVDTVNRPEPVRIGTAVVRLVVVAAETAANCVF